MEIAIWFFVGLCVYVFIGGLLHRPLTWISKKLSFTDPEFVGYLVTCFWPITIVLSIPVALLVGLGSGANQATKGVVHFATRKKRQEEEEKKSMVDSLNAEVMSALKLEPPGDSRWGSLDEVTQAFSTGEISVDDYIRYRGAILKKGQPL